MRLANKSVRHIEPKAKTAKGSGEANLCLLHFFLTQAGRGVRLFKSPLGRGFGGGLKNMGQPTHLSVKASQVHPSC